MKTGSVENRFEDKFRMHFVSSLIIISLYILLFIVPVKATNYYVKPTGNNGNVGTGTSNGEAWKTVSYAASQVSPGDTVFIMAGTYGEGVVINESGTNANPIVFKNYPGDFPTLDGTSNSIAKLINLVADYIVIDGLEIQSFQKYGVWMEGDHNMVRNCTVHDNRVQGSLILTLGNYNVVTKNTVYNSTWNGINVISAIPNGHTSIGNIVHGNTCYNTNHMGINIFPAPGSEGPIEYINVKYNIIYDGAGVNIYTRHLVNSVIANNITYNSLYDGLYFTQENGITPNPYNGNARIYNNNFVFSTSGWGIHNETNIGAVTKNNILYDNYLGALDGRPMSNFTNFMSNPLFVDYANADFTLQSNSPCINAGSFLTSITSPTGSGTSFIVGDPYYFMDGWDQPASYGITGDTIMFEGQSIYRTITDIDYSTATITVNSGVSWAQGDSISIPYAGSRPDIGAIEFRVSSAPNPPQNFHEVF